MLELRQFADHRPQQRHIIDRSRTNGKHWPVGKPSGLSV
jgi:hypothetical protein